MRVSGSFLRVRFPPSGVPGLDAPVLRSPAAAQIWKRIVFEFAADSRKPLLILYLRPLFDSIRLGSFLPERPAASGFRNALRAVSLFLNLARLENVVISKLVAKSRNAM